MNIARTIASIVAPVLCVWTGGCLWTGCLGDLVVKAPADAGDEAALGCSHATVPPPPTAVDDPSNNVSFITAIRTVQFEASAGQEPLGLDLDRYCSCQGESSSCIAPKGQDTELECDGPQGRDNQSQYWTTLFAFVSGFETKEQLAELYSAFAELGRWSVLVRVSGYNGMPDDSKVRVDWLPSPGTPNPTWNGTDTWPFSVNAAMPNGDPLYYDEFAYVANNKLVFSLPMGPLHMSNGSTQLDLRISDATVVATIGKDATDRYDLTNGLLAGRISTENMFHMLAEFRDHNGLPFCTTGNPYYASFRDGFCRMSDIQVGSPSPSKRCDATSFAMGFNADPIATAGFSAGPDAGPDAGPINCPSGEDPLSAYLDAGCPQIP